MKGAGAWAIDGIHGGTLLGARGSGFVLFWDWETGEIVRRIEADAKNVGLRSTFFYIPLSPCSLGTRLSGPALVHSWPSARKSLTMF